MYCVYALCIVHVYSVSAFSAYLCLTRTCVLCVCALHTDRCYVLQRVAVLRVAVSCNVLWCHTHCMYTTYT